MSIAPELVVGILSSIERELALENKLRDYSITGVRECWVVRPEDKVVGTFHLASEGEVDITIFTEDEIVTSSLLPNLAIAVTDILKPEELL